MNNECLKIIQYYIITRVWSKRSYYQLKRLLSVAELRINFFLRLYWHDQRLWIWMLENQCFCKPKMINTVVQFVVKSINLTKYDQIDYNIWIRVCIEFRVENDTLSLSWKKSVVNWIPDKQIRFSVQLHWTRKFTLRIIICQ